MQTRFEAFVALSTRGVYLDAPGLIFGGCMQSINAVLWGMFALLGVGAIVIVGGLFAYRAWVKSGQERGY